MLSLPRRAFAEALGTVLLVAAVVGSGIMARSLSGGNEALALLCNARPTGAMLVVLVTVFGPLSGAHLNPAVTLILAARGMFARADALPYVLAQFVGGIAGTMAAHLMFGLAPLSIGDRARSGGGQWLGEIVATFVLVLVILAGIRHAPKAIPWLVGLTILAGYWFTSSTSFANPAVTLARGFTTTFTCIALWDVPGFVVAQLCGAALAAAIAVVLLPDNP
jgi:glycerol uptake facilitator-like aquaporin